MLTIFAAAKPFRGRAATIQRNALHSWMQLHDDVQIILFGDAEGTQEVAWELGLHFEATPQLTSTGAVRLDYMMAAARRHARHNVLCFIACDIRLQRDFCEALNRVEALHHEFVMVGRAAAGRANACNAPDTTNTLAAKAHGISLGSASETQHARLDYVIFSRNCFVADVPELPAHSPFAAKWLMRRAMANEVRVVDASRMVSAWKQIDLENDCPAIAETPAARRNLLCAEEKLVLFGEYGHLLGMMRAPYLLTPKDIVANRWLRVRQWGTSTGPHNALLSRAWQGLKAQLRRPHELPTANRLLGADILDASQRQP
ncbi:MAG TPA: hypothetical protein VE545_07800 [Candidatus Dormibacteraeota bacterium]|jgi:hypothetical protein|nr:hypothetical protein [Candidatus Dormibacteraeota bacterium]